jgi:hypothetical protein
VAVCILDTHAVIETSAGEAHASVGPMDWPHLKARALADSDFLERAFAEASIADKAELTEVLSIMERTPVRAEPNTPDPSLSQKAKAIAVLLDKKYSANDLFTGIGATMNPAGQLGVREVMVNGNRTGFQLTDGNHTLVRIGTLTQEDLDAIQ